MNTTEDTMTPDLYYHAGCYDSESDTTSWSDITWGDRSLAAFEARGMARHGGTPIIEWWPRSAGEFPGDADVVLGCEDV